MSDINSAMTLSPWELPISVNTHTHTHTHSYDLFITGRCNTRYSNHHTFTPLPCTYSGFYMGQQAPPPHKINHYNLPKATSHYYKDIHGESEEHMSPIFTEVCWQSTAQFGLQPTWHDWCSCFSILASLLKSERSKYSFPSFVFVLNHRRSFFASFKASNVVS